MNNINITSERVQFIRNDSTISANLIEPKWESVDEKTFHVITEQGVYLLWLTDNTINDASYTSSIDLVAYLNSL